MQTVLDKDGRLVVAETGSSPTHGAGVADYQPDAEGFSPENALGATAAPHYRQWEFDTVAPYLGRSVLEVGAGMGHFSETLAAAGLDRLVLGDTEQYCLDRLATTYADRPDVEVASVPLPGPVEIGAPVDTVVAMNVLEHIEDDVQALRDLAAKVTPGGRILLWVPAYMQLYGEFDKKVGHFRRYTPATLRPVVEQAGLTVEKLRPMNFLGGIAWWLAVHRSGVGAPRPRMVWLYDNLVVPVTRTAERVVRPPFGQSVFCVVRVPA
jgi:SAM-dependent methyltransferase